MIAPPICQVHDGVFLDKLLKFGTKLLIKSGDLQKNSINAISLLMAGKRPETDGEASSIHADESVTLEFVPQNTTQG